MRTVTHADDLHALVAGFRRDGRRIALVPTMGNLHAGHHSLIAIARMHADVVIASVFVNPTQFGPHEDFARYPRTPEADATGLAAHGCDVLFMPAVEEMYPFGAANMVSVSVPGLRDVLEGATRPGHFDGVASVVARLFNFAQPQIAVFGQKDYQQLLVIRRMTRDLGYPIQIVAAPIMREENGLAMSSRNRYLDAGEHERAAAIHVTLQAMRDGVLHSTLPLAAIQARAVERLKQAGLAPDYAVLRQADDLGEVLADRRDGLIALIAARSGSTRLIDNLICA
ncbi:MAG: pantoate--beta-alanine ligase [Rhodanobacter sp.]|jgi:pantoate--beta-alanine ligase|nr:pantoate--beta-alanine ligase [Rhodanobacter sp.]